MRCKSLNLLTSGNTIVGNSIENNFGFLVDSQIETLFSNNENNLASSSKKESRSTVPVKRKCQKDSRTTDNDKNREDSTHYSVKLITVTPIKKNSKDSTSYEQESTMEIFRNENYDNNGSWIPKITTVMSLNDKEQNFE